jgi:hypothetical protein
VTNEILDCCASRYLFSIFRLRRHPAFKSAGKWPPARLVSRPDKTMRSARSRAVLPNAKYGTCCQLPRSTLRRADLHSRNPRSLRFKALRSLRPLHDHCLQRYEDRLNYGTAEGHRITPLATVRGVFAIYYFTAQLPDPWHSVKNARRVSFETNGSFGTIKRGLRRRTTLVDSSG